MKHSTRLAAKTSQVKSEQPEVKPSCCYSYEVRVPTAEVPRKDSARKSEQTIHQEATSGAWEETRQDTFDHSERSVRDFNPSNQNIDFE